jgi:regulator of protease activity HflC (stomatin/prohibitin superfamily)
MNRTQFNITTIAAFLILLFVFISGAYSNYGFLQGLSTSTEPGKTFLIKTIVYGLGSLVFLVWLIKSFKMVDHDEIGGVYCFGKAVLDIGPGLIVAPTGLFRFIKEKNLIMQFQIPEDLQDEKPIRIVHTLLKNGTNDPLEKRQVTDISVIGSFKIKEYTLFKSNIGTKQELIRQIRDVIVTEVLSECTKYTPLNLLNSKESLNAVLAIGIASQVSKWGIDFIKLSIERVDIKQALTDAFEQTPILMATREAREELSKINQIENFDRGKAISTLLQAQGEGFKLLAQQVNMSPGDVLKLNILLKVLQNASLSIREISTMGGGIGTLFYQVMNHVDPKNPSNGPANIQTPRLN